MTDDMRPAVREAYIRAFSDEDWGAVTSEDLEVFENREIRWLVAVEGDTVAGFMAYRIGKQDEISREFSTPTHILYGQKIGYEAELGVVPDFQGRELSHKLTRAMVDLFAQEGIDQFLVYTRVGTRNYKRYLERLYLACACEDGRVFFTYPAAPIHLCPKES